MWLRMENEDKWQAVVIAAIKFRVL
jgi:hypothetical protein